MIAAALQARFRSASSDSPRLCGSARDSIAFEWVFGKPMNDPVPAEFKAHLPSSWIKTRSATSETIEAELA